MSQSELDSLRAEAHALGLKPLSNASAAIIRAMLEGYKAAQEVANSSASSIEGYPDIPEPALDSRQEALRLVRVRVLCRDAEAARNKGVIIRGGNSETGLVQKYIPFGENWHVPVILLNIMKEAELMQVNDTDPKNVRFESVPLYDILELPPLTEAEYLKLQEAQKLLNASVGA